MTAATIYPQFLSHDKKTKWGTERDSQKQRVYNSEYALRKQTPNFPNVASAQAYIDTITSSSFWKQMRGPSHITLISIPQRSRKCSAWISRCEIRIAEPWGLNQLVLTHELSHFLVRPPHADHGKLFCRIYLNLVCLFISRDIFGTLKSNYRANGVRH